MNEKLSSSPSLTASHPLHWRDGEGYVAVSLLI